MGNFWHCFCIHLITNKKTMKKTTLFFAMTLAMVSAAFSQHAPAGGHGPAKTLTYDQFMAHPKNYDGQQITLTDVVVDASPAATSQMTCKTNPDQVKVAISAKGTGKTPSSLCFKGDKTTFDTKTQQGKKKFNASVTIMGTEKDGYTISSPQFGTAVN
jgi:hypothetical protein